MIWTAFIQYVSFCSKLAEREPGVSKLLREIEWIGCVVIHEWSGWTLPGINVWIWWIPLGHTLGIIWWLLQYAWSWTQGWSPIAPWSFQNILWSHKAVTTLRSRYSNEAGSHGASFIQSRQCTDWFVRPCTLQRLSYHPVVRVLHPCVWLLSVLRSCMARMVSACVLHLV